MLRIASRNNPKLKEAARLVASSRERRKAGKCVIEGEHLIDAYAERYGAPETLIVADALLARPGIDRLVRRFDERTLIVSESMFDEMSALPSGVGVLAVVPTPRPSTFEPGLFCLLLEDVQDPGNVGSMLRSAAAAGVTQAFLSRDCAFAWSPKVLRAGMGAHFALDIHEDVDPIEWAATFRQRSGRVVAMVREGGESIFSVALERPLAIVIGNEGAGLSQGLVDASSVQATIPMPGRIESLNAASAAAVALFECVRRLPSAKPESGH
ncbi:MAG TPA: RNA methyltransferase [Casimicrobiaceae bacterium]|nr:RNA methyltransferase [Casimicrobiaceae bacterium]